jgi:hypothetical protein
MNRELAESQARLEQMQESDRRRAAARLEREGLGALDDYHRKLLGLPTREREAREQAEANRAQATRRKEIAERLRPNGIVFRSEFIEKLCEHAIDLVVKHGITNVYLQHDGGGAAYQESRSISVPPVTNESSYATVLHEIGHLVDPEADSRQHRNVVRKNERLSSDGEIGAWFFAAKNALTWTREMHDDMYYALGVYYKDLATEDELERIKSFVQWSGLRIADRPLTWDQLQRQCGNLTKTTSIAPAVAVDASPSVYKGGWKAGPYAAGDVVVMAGSIWRARVATTALPAINDEWVLVARNEVR